MSDTTKYPLLLHGDTRQAIGFVEFIDSTMKDITACGIAVEITPLITAGSNRIEGWSLNVIPASKYATDIVSSKSHPTRLIDDPRPITMLTFPFQEAEQPGLTVGCKLFGQEVTRIVAYEEAGEMAMVLWFAVYGKKDGKWVNHPDEDKLTELSMNMPSKDSDEIIYRIQGKYIESIGYQEEGSAV